MLAMLRFSDEISVFGFLVASFFYGLIFFFLNLTVLTLDPHLPLFEKLAKGLMNVGAGVRVVGPAG